MKNIIKKWFSGADPGFPQEGAPTYKFARFSQKLHEIKKTLVSPSPRFHTSSPVSCGFFPPPSPHEQTNTTDNSFLGGNYNNHVRMKQKRSNIWVLSN